MIAIRMIAIGEEFVLNRLPNEMNLKLTEERKGYLLSRYACKFRCCDYLLNLSKERDYYRTREQLLMEALPLNAVEVTLPSPTSPQHISHLTLAIKYLDLFIAVPRQDMCLPEAQLCLARVRELLSYCAITLEYDAKYQCGVILHVHFLLLGD